MSSKARKGISLLTIALIAVVIYPFARLYSLHQPFLYIVPNILLFTGFRDLTYKIWLNLNSIDTRIKHEPAPIPVIYAEDYSFDALRIASDNFKTPVVVRKLFINTPAVQKWLDPLYLPSKLGHFDIPVIRKATTKSMQNDRVIMKFRDSFDEVIGQDSSLYIFFPVKSRFNFNGSDEGSSIRLQNTVNEIVFEDLQPNKLIWNGFGYHKNFFGSQFIIGKGKADSSKTTGSGWHCAGGSNYFIQIAGRKRWYFVDQENSPLMFPLRGGVRNMWTGNADLSDLHEHLPLKYVDLEPGDMLYNPDWMWHTVVNYEGLSIGVPLREGNASLLFRNNLLYTMITGLNVITHNLGLNIGGYIPMAGEA